jgi:hypothetical protein
MKVYVVGFGSYSDQHNHAAYTSADHADAVARSTGTEYEPGWVDELELDPPLDEEVTIFIRPGERLYQVVMDGDGNNAQAWVGWDKESTDRFGVAKDKSRFSCETWATSEEHAIKILNDRRAQWIALGQIIEQNPNNVYWYKGTYK